MMFTAHRDGTSCPLAQHANDAGGATDGDDEEDGERGGMGGREQVYTTRVMTSGKGWLGRRGAGEGVGGWRVLERWRSR